VVIPLTKEEGKIAGPFGKAGKCKVIFDQGISADAIGAKAELYTPAS
jgi:ribosomal protein L35AE/L33A